MQREKDYSIFFALGAHQMARRKTKEIRIGNVRVGGDATISVQSMTCTETADVNATVGQIKALEAACCEIARVAVPDMDAANAVAEIKRSISIPLVADIHFDWRLALVSLDGGGGRSEEGRVGEEGGSR